MNILVLGSGGREHALAHSISKSKHCDQLFIAPGNAGTDQLGTNLSLNPNQFGEVAEAIRKHAIGLVVVGPEEPLVRGIREYLEAQSDLSDLIIVGPGKDGAHLEGSKEYAKEFMLRNGIPTAGHRTFTVEELEDGYAYLETLKPPYVLKADGLAAGKGVVILKNLDSAKVELQNMLLRGKFGEAGARVVIEEFLDGIEFSVFALTDGTDYIILPEAKDYKRIGEGDTGPNTGGMGAVSPVPFFDEELRKKVEERIIKPTISGLSKEGIPYQGFIFFGLIRVGEDPFVIEYNVRLGDPETEVVLPRIKSDLVELFLAMGRQEISTVQLELDDRFATTVMVVSGGYPGTYEKGKTITGLDDVKESIVFHAGTKRDAHEILTHGGRVLAFTSFGETKKEALETSYASIGKMAFEDMYFRKDIGFDL
ncbi:MAG: phosphoribosylamine--glycine ligase [Bacteroidota bacterium]|nr:phosphoribosylamine--glycine ligase [Bacteroidota bacterium]MDX5506980.1 phosphoribosylamine--glycine ligase [Bacteroidota bacterium]